MQLRLLINFQTKALTYSVDSPAIQAMAYYEKAGVRNYGKVGNVKVYYVTPGLVQGTFDFSMKDNTGSITVVKEREGDELAVVEELLQEVITFFGLEGDKFDRSRIAVIRQVGHKYTPQKGEKIVKRYYLQLTTRDGR